MLILLTIIYGLSILKCASNMVLAPRSYPVEKKSLYAPPLEEVAEAFRSYLPTNFATVNVEVVDSPDLTKEPFLLASEGLGGNPKLLEIGDAQYLFPVAMREKLYDLKDADKLADVQPAFIIGPGAGPLPYTNTNAEAIVNLKIVNGIVDQQTRTVKLDGADEHMLIQELPNNETRISFVGNLYISEGKPGKVIKVHVKKRSGSKDFIAALRNAIEEKYGKQDLIGLGGTFLIADGKAIQHVVRNFSETNATSVDGDHFDEAVKFFEMSAPLVAVGTFTSNDGGDLNLPLQHFHSFSTHGEAGHYYNDTTADTVEYLGYFNVAREVVRIDKPPTNT